MGLLFGKLIRLDFGIQLIGWIISSKLRTEKFFDITGRFFFDGIFHHECFHLGSLTFILLTYLSRKQSQQTLRQNVQSACVLIWALRYISNYSKMNCFDWRI